MCFLIEHKVRKSIIEDTKKEKHKKMKIDRELVKGLSKLL